VLQVISLACSHIPVNRAALRGRAAAVA
jgi:hypothetical protein